MIFIGYLEMIRMEMTRRSMRNESIFPGHQIPESESCEDTGERTWMKNREVDSPQSIQILLSSLRWSSRRVCLRGSIFETYIL